MNTRNKISLSLVCFLLVLAANVSAEPRVELEGRYWQPSLKGQVSVTTENISGTDIDLNNDLGLDKQGLPEARLLWHSTKNSELRLAYMRMNYSAAQAISQSFVFNGKTYTVGTNVDSDFKVQYVRLGWIWQPIHLVDDKVKLGPIVDLKGFFFDTSLNASAVGVTESKKFMGGLPTIGLALNINPNKYFSVFAEVSGIGTGSYGHLFDAEAGVKIHPTQNLSIEGGYRVFNLDVTVNNNKGNIELAGPFAGVVLKF